MNKAQTFGYLETLSIAKKAEKETHKDKNEESFLCVCVQKEKLYIPIEHVEEIIPSPTIAPLGHTKPWLEGILKAGGKIYSVINFSLFLDSQAKHERAMYVIALSNIEGNYAIIINRVLGIVKMQAPQLVSSGQYKDIYQNETSKEKISVLSIHHLIESAEFMNPSVF